MNSTHDSNPDSIQTNQSFFVPSHESDIIFFSDYESGWFLNEKKTGRNRNAFFSKNFEALQPVPETAEGVIKVVLPIVHNSHFEF